jgi:hypothetical protein
MATHPANAVFVSGDGKVSFNENGRKLDSNGNVVWRDRQGLRGANARVRPEIVEAYQREEEAQRQAQQQAPPVQEYRPPSGQGGSPASTSNPWAGVSAWDAPMDGQNWRQYKPPAPAPAWEPPPSGLAGQPQQQAQNWNQYAPPQRSTQPAWEPPPSGLAGQPQQQQAQQQMFMPLVQNWNRFRR